MVVLIVSIADVHIKQQPPLILQENCSKILSPNNSQNQMFKGAILSIFLTLLISMDFGCNAV